MLPLAFAIGSAWSIVYVIVAPQILGSHAAIYAEAARAWLTGGNPWQTGPALVVFAGPPPMLLPYAPFAFLPADVIRFAWVALDLGIAVWALRRLGLAPYWLLFPPLVESIVLGHPEVLVLGLLVVSLSKVAGPAAGLAVLVKPYAALPLLAELRIRALIVGAVAGIVTLPFLPWGMFLQHLPEITANVIRQSHGDSTYGNPVLMGIAIAALAVLGLRRGLWLAVPVLWPFAQPNYKVMSIAVLPPVVALAWAMPIPGATLVGIVALAVLVTVERRRPLPSWLAEGIRPASKAFDEDGSEIRSGLPGQWLGRFGLRSKAGAGASATTSRPA